MKKIVVVGIVIWLVLGLTVGAFAFQNEPEGFRGLKWGDPPGEDMKYFDSTNGYEHYVLSKEDRYFGDIELEQILYGFHGDPGRLVYVTLFFKGKTTYERLEAFCRQEYGEENVEGLDDGSPHWEGEDTIMGFDYDTEKEEGSLGMASLSVLAEIMMEEMQKAFAEAMESE